MNRHTMLIQQSRRCECVDPTSENCNASCRRHSPTEPLCHLLAQSRIVNAVAPRNDERIEWRRLVDIQLWHYDESTFRQAPTGADTECQNTIARELATAAGWHSCSRKSLGRSSQLSGGHLLEYNQTDRFRSHGVSSPF